MRTKQPNRQFSIWTVACEPQSQTFNEREKCPEDIFYVIVRERPFRFISMARFIFAIALVSHSQTSTYTHTRV